MFGYGIYLYGGLISFASKQLKTVAHSSCEAEYAAASFTCKEIVEGGSYLEAETQKDAQIGWKSVYTTRERELESGQGQAHYTRTDNRTPPRDHDHA